MPTFYQSKAAKGSFGQWGARVQAMQMRNLTGEEEDEKYHASIHTWQHSKPVRCTENDDIPILPTIAPIRQAGAVQSLIVRIKGEKDEKRFSAVLKSLDCNDFIYYDREGDWNVFQIVFIHSFHWMMFIRKAPDLIHPTDPLYKFRNWRFLKYPICIMTKRGPNYTKISEHDPFKLDEIEGKKDTYCVNPDLCLNQALELIVSNYMLQKICHK